MNSLLDPQFDQFRLVIPEYFFTEEQREKYAEMFRYSRQLFKDPVEFLNQTIVSVQFLGVGNGTVVQEQIGRGANGENYGTVNRFGQVARIDQNRFAHPSSEIYYRSSKNPLAMIDKSVKITFRHTLGFWNYFFMFEAFQYQAMRDLRSDSDQLRTAFTVDILDAPHGSCVSKMILMDVLIDSIDPLELSFQKVHPDAQTFTVTFKFNNIDFQFDPEQLTGIFS